MYFGYMDYTYVIYVLPAVVLSIWASIMVKARFSHYSKIQSRRNITGAQAAAYLLKVNGITDVKIRQIGGHLTDNYNPSSKILSLSTSTYGSTSIAAIGVAAHETGHAIQHHLGYAPLGLRSMLVPLANIGSNAGPTLAIAGIILGGFAQSSSMLSIANLVSEIGIILFAVAVLFYIVTLPVEFNASHRALDILKSSNTLDKNELRGVRRVLAAAAMTYVASALVAIGNLIRLMVIADRRNSRR